jgi:hypothetical protein
MTGKTNIYQRLLTISQSMLKLFNFSQQKLARNPDSDKTHKRICFDNRLRQSFYVRFFKVRSEQYMLPATDLMTQGSEVR